MKNLHFLALLLALLFYYHRISIHASTIARKLKVQKLEASVNISEASFSTMYSSGFSCTLSDGSSSSNPWNMTIRKTSGLLELNLHNIQGVMGEIGVLEMTAQFDCSQRAPGFALHVSPRTTAVGFGCKLCPESELQIVNQDLSLFSSYREHTYQTMRTLPEVTRDIVPVRRDKNACVKMSIDVNTGTLDVAVFLIDPMDNCAKYSTDEIFFHKKLFSSRFIISPNTQHLYIGMNRLIGSLSRRGSSLKHLKVAVLAKEPQLKIFVPDSVSCWQYSSNPSDYVCDCQLGFVWDDFTRSCNDFDECAMGLHDCVHSCHNRGGSYACKCFEGYIVDPHFPSNCLDINECELESNLCPDNTCVNTMGSYYCDCGPEKGLYRDCHSDEYFCGPRSDIGKSLHPSKSSFTSCSTSTSLSIPNSQTNGVCRPEEQLLAGCQHGCSSERNRVFCKCHENFQFNVTDPSRCIPLCTLNNFGCVHYCTDSNVFGEPTCSCWPGFQTDPDNPKMCLDVDECRDIAPCSHTCVNTYGGYLCTCPKGYALQQDKTQCQDIDECSFLGDLLCDQICTNTEGSFECSCRPGFELYGSKHCVDIDECSEMNDNGGCEQICVNTQGGHYCACEKGYILHRNLFGCLEDQSSCPSLKIGTEKVDAHCSVDNNMAEVCDLRCSHADSFFAVANNRRSITLSCAYNTHNGGFWYTDVQTFGNATQVPRYLDAPECFMPELIYCKLTARVALRGAFCKRTVEYILKKKEKFRKGLRNIMEDIKTGKELCPGGFSCDIGEINVTCADLSDRPVTEKEYWVFYIPVEIMKTSAQWQRSLESIMEGISSYLQTKLYSEHVLASGVLKSSRVEPLKETQVNTTTVVINMRAKDCPPGTFLHKTFGYCVSCPKGTVQVNKECVSCPIGSKPSKKLKRCQDCSEPGAFSPGKMKCGGLCTPGHFASYKGTMQRGCQSCPLGSYQPRFGKTSCLPCPYNTTHHAAVKCVSNNHEIICPHNYYSMNNKCNICPPGTKTDSTGSNINRCKGAKCMNLVMGNYSGVVASPNWPFNYPNNVFCDVTLSTHAARRTIMMLFPSVDFGLNSNLYDEFSIVGLETGKVYHMQYKSETEKPIVKFLSIDEDRIAVRFNSDSEENGIGFIMFYMFVADLSLILREQFEDRATRDPSMSDLLRNPFTTALFMNFTQAPGERTASFLPGPVFKYFILPEIDRRLAAGDPLFQTIPTVI